MGQHRRGVAAVLAIAAAFLMAAGIGAYGAMAILDEDEFADRAVSTLSSDEVRDDIGLRISGRLTESRPELSPGEPMLEDAVATGVTSTPAFEGAFRDGALRLHASLFGDSDAEAAMIVTGSGRMLREELRRRMPGASVPAVQDVPIFTIGYGRPERALRRIAPLASAVALPLSIVLGLGGLALLALAMVREPDRRRTVWAAGLAVAAAGGLTAAGVTAAHDLVLDNFDTGVGDAVVGDVWDAYVHDLRVWALALCAAGLVAAAGAGGPRPPVATLLAAPASRRGRALRATGLLAVAALAVQIPELVLHTGLVALAAGLFYVAAGDLMRVLAPPTCAARRLRAAAVAAALLGLIAVALV
jgi:hypothetical protein